MDKNTSKDEKVPDRKAREKYEQAHREQGLCEKCSRPAWGYRRLCKHHIMNKRVYMRWLNPIRKQKYFEQRRCYTCGTPLDVDEVKYCLNCTEGNRHATINF